MSLKKGIRRKVKECFEKHYQHYYLSSVCSKPLSLRQLLLTLAQKDATRYFTDGLHKNSQWQQLEQAGIVRTNSPIPNLTTVKQINTNQSNNSTPPPSNNSFNVLCRAKPKPLSSTITSLYSFIFFACLVFRHANDNTKKTNFSDFNTLRRQPIAFDGSLLPK